MGCNAWNHSASCNCGWGGVNYGNYSIPTPKVPDGRDWFKPAVTVDSYVNPNARCPYCGDNVYFYQSPYGGRVFFDELGPPWPKHPCTDRNYERVQHADIERPLKTHNRKATSSLRLDGWKPVTFTKRISSGGFDMFLLDSKIVETNGRFIVLPRGKFVGVPLFWKLDLDAPETILVSSFTQGPDKSWTQQIEKSPSWIYFATDIHAYKENNHPTAKTLNNICWNLLFKWRDVKNDNWLQHKNVNATGAKACFEKTAALDSWEGHNNLGVIYRDGLGVGVDEKLAFKYFEIAAKSMNKVPMKHLADCYRKGIGVEPYEEMAQLYEKYMNPSYEF